MKRLEEGCGRSQETRVYEHQEYACRDFRMERGEGQGRDK